MEASALRAPAGLGRLPLGAPLLRLRSDEQLVALFRAGSDEAFRVLHDRYRQRLFAYVRQMLSSHSRQDAEDVLQDVFVRAFGALRNDSRDVCVRAWLYRVAHNRCIDHLRRPTPAAAEIFDVSRKPLHDPVEEAQRRDDLKRLVADVGRLPEQQRSAILMRELDGLSYADLAGALDVTVPAVKSLLVRARVGLVEAQEARDTSCKEIRRDLHASYDRGVKASGRARRHLRECDGCRQYRVALRGVRRSFAALVPGASLGPALAAKLLGVGGSGAAAAGGASAGAGAGASAGTGIALVGGAGAACKVAAVVCATAIGAGGAAVEVQRLTHQERAREAPRSAPAAPREASTAVSAPAVHATRPAPAAHAAKGAAAKDRPARTSTPAGGERHIAHVTGAAAPAPALPVDGAFPWSRQEEAAPVVSESGGTLAPDPPAEEVAPADPTAEGVPAATGDGGTPAAEAGGADAEAATAGAAVISAETGGMADEDPVPAGELAPGPGD